MNRSAFPCALCDLHATATTVCMGATSPAKPTFAIYAEAPGREEDEQGMPLIGPSGRLLWAELERHCLYRDDAFVSNVVRCRPPDNRTPKVSELNECHPFTLAELEWLKEQGCKTILALGAKAYKQLGGTGSITEYQGMPYQWEGFTIVPCLHPAAVLRSPQAKEGFKESIAAFARVLRGKAPRLPSVEVTCVTDTLGILDMEQELRDAPLISFDIETVGLDEKHPRAQIICASYSGAPGKSYVVLLNHPARTGALDSMQEALSQFHQSRNGWVAQNGKFDCKYLAEHGIVPPKLSHDLIFMAHLSDENSPKNIESIASRYAGYPGWGHYMRPHFDAIHKAVKKGDSVPYPPLKDLSLYAGLDASIELELASTAWKSLDPSLRRLHNFLVMVSRTLQSVERYGVYIDRNELLRMQAHCEEEMEQAVHDFAQASGKSPDEVKLGSTRWLAQVLFEEKELPLIKFTENGAGSTNEHSMKKLRAYAPDLVDPVLRYRKYQKWLGSYLRPWELKLVNDRLHCVYNITGTVTGRLSCSNPKMWPQGNENTGMSLHQVPRDGEIRGVVAAPNGRKLLVADYSQIELVVAAALSNEPRMMQAYRNGEDLHTLTAATITGKDPSEVTAEERQRAKPVNFGFLYGMSANGFVDYAFDEYDIEFSLEESKNHRDNYFRLFRGLPRWHKEMEDFVRRHAYVLSPLGRIRRLPDIHSPERGFQFEAVRQAINSPVQATASDFTLAAMVLIHRALAKYDAAVVGQVHDSILVECAEDVADDVAQLVKWVMEKKTPEWIASYFGYVFPLPLAAEVVIGQRWGQKEKVLD